MNPMEGYNITTIPVKRKKYTGAIRTAIYCRVSSAKKSQIESLSAQISGLTSQIAYRPDYVLVDVYIDVAPGDTLKGRPGFQRMIADCKNGKIEYIITKSASRFSRDIIIALEAIRQCRTYEVPIYFVAEDLKSDDPMLDVQLTAHLAVAEQDNLSRKDNINWGLKTGAELGTSKLYNKVCYGYKHDKKGNLVIDEEAANIVRFVFRLYLDGYSILGIIEKLKTCRIKSPSGKETWNKHYMQTLPQHRLKSRLQMRNRLHKHILQQPTTLHIPTTGLQPPR